MRTTYGANAIWRNGKIKINRPPVGINAGKGAIMNNKTVSLTATERSYLIIELQMNLNDLMQKYKKADKSGDEAAYYILSDARFIADLLNKIKGEDEE